jgi:hypothetical protein
MVTVAGLGDQLHPAVIALAGPIHHLTEDTVQQLAHANRPRHAALPCVWPATDVGMIAVENRQRGEEVKRRCSSGSPTGHGGS